MNITWAIKRDRVWDPVARMMVVQPDDVRTGVVFSAGPVTSTAWVIPDEPREGEGHAVCVFLSAAGNRQRPVDLRRSSLQVHQATLANLAAGRSVPACVVPSMPRGYELERGA